MKKILLIGTGGTISCEASEDGLAPAKLADELLKYCPKVKYLCEVECAQVINIDSTNMRPKHWLMIAETIKENYDKYDGFVITHGTDTLAYTSSALSYLIQNSKKPIVITGAQLPISEVGVKVKKEIKLLEAYDMSTESAFTKLMWVLSRNVDFEEAEKLFYKRIANDILTYNIK